MCKVNHLGPACSVRRQQYVILRLPWCRLLVLASPRISSSNLTNDTIASENREIHQTIPDHRVKLTPEGWTQAHEAGRKLRSLLRPDDTLHFFTSPYRRTRETTEGILDALTSSTPSPSPFPRHTIKVYEEPRLREQDFGNFQPDKQTMAKMWEERAAYGHFFYRIPNGESAADAYDRVSGFNESLWRSFGEDDFASVCVLVTHGLMTRVFLTKWYHFSVEYFEDLRNVEHCEFVVMKLRPDGGKYVLQNRLRTWSDLRRERRSERAPSADKGGGFGGGYGGGGENPSTPVIPFRKEWGARDEDGEDEEGGALAARRMQLRRRRQNTAELFMDEQLVERENEGRRSKDPLPPTSTPASKGNGLWAQQRDSVPSNRKDWTSVDPQTSEHTAQSTAIQEAKKVYTRDLLHSGRDGGGSRSGAESPKESGSEDHDRDAKEHMRMLPVRSSLSLALRGKLGGERAERPRADALGDQSDAEDDENVSDTEREQRLEKLVDGSVR